MVNPTKGFTLIELLIVIGILAVLSTVAVLVLNPAQILAESRDVQRLADLDAVRNAIALTLSSATSTVALGTNGLTNTTSTNCPFSSCTTVTSVAVDGTGWAAVNLNLNSGGSPLSRLPSDPRNNGDYFYAYKGDDSVKNFELDDRLESLKYRTRMESDGGNKNTCTGNYVDATCFYEVGTRPGLDF